MKQSKKTTIEVQVEGISPLLINRFIDASIVSKSKKRTGSLEDAKVEDKLYIHDGNPCIPGIYFRNAIVEASKQFKIQGKGKATYSKLVGSTVDIEPEMIILNPGDYFPWSIAGVNPMTRGRMMVCRPRFDSWGAKFKIILNDDGVPVSVMNEIVEHAGRYVGVGDWRPDKKGMFGKFMITSFREV